MSGMTCLIFNDSPLLGSHIHCCLARQRGGGRGGERSGEMHSFLFILLSAGFATGWLRVHLLCQVGMFPREQETFSRVCQLDGSLSVEVLPISSVQSHLAFGINTVNKKWPESMKPFG